MLGRACEQLRSALAFPDLYIAVCDWARGLLVNNGIDPQRIVVCRHGVERGQGRSLAQGRGDAVCFGFIGRFCPEKGLDILLRAFSALPRQMRAQLYVWGQARPEGFDQRYYRQVRRFVDRDARVHWCGSFTPDKRDDAFSSMDVLVVPSRWPETGPLVVREAWARGIPVIGAAYGGIAELVQQQRGGMLFRYADAADLTAVLARVCRAPEVLRSIAETIPKVRTLDDVVHEMEALYSGADKSKAL
jgi:glycosyltransferase involved in cell wall biosynthesis